MATALPFERTADGVVLLTLIPNPSKPRGGVVVLDAWLIGELLAFFDELAKGPAPTGFVLQSGSSRVFVAGADLAEIDALDDPGLDAYLRKGAEAFGRIAALPCASVAAINSSALGGGLEIAMHCDALIGIATGPTDKPYRIGLPECGLAICPGWGGTQMLPARIDPALAIRSTALGETWKSSEVPAGLLAATVPTPADLRAAALAWLQANPRRGSRSHPIAIDRSNADRVRTGLEAARSTIRTGPSGDSAAAAAVVDAVETGLRDGWTKAVDAERRHLIRLRHTPEARAKLEAFFAKA
ncbi:MAG: enoyl-CoA hydratase/isomerase family protein [Phycisphaerae bacterium]|jgi:3-hydroxyacyl-CoA dehydrogenase|nr:enoyl-CoA hydratase/isomerase family protein [Phycisphaerae bacterium]